MSWNLIIYKAGKTSQQIEPLGDLNRVTDALNGAFIDLEWESRTAAVLPVEGGFRVNLTMQDARVQDIHTDGGFNHLRQLAGLCKREGWRMADAQEGEDVDLDDPQKWYKERSARTSRLVNTTKHGERPARVTARRASHYRISKWLILLFFVAGLGLLAFYIWHGYVVRQARHWPMTLATVTSCQVTSATNLIQGEFGNSVRRSEDLRFAFSYKVSGRDYSSRRFYLLGYPPTHVVARDFPVGQQFSARYNPASPETAVVEPGPLYNRVMVLAVICLGLAGAGFIYNRFQT